MSFEDRRMEQGRDLALGKPLGMSQVPWVGAPTASELMRLRMKARGVLDGSVRFDNREIQFLLASLILSDA